MLLREIAGYRRIKLRHTRASSSGRQHNSRGTSTCSAGSARGTARAGPLSAGASSGAALSAGRTLNQSSSDAAQALSCLGAKNVGVSDRQVVTGDCKIEVIL